ncbi:MAG: potassium transporter TrkG [Helicobacter sp.]|nr:potassium transporter TrkG [Helicobacter sp.]
MQLKSVKFVLFYYVGIALFGGFLLSLPFANNNPTTFVDAFFTAVSAITCTGLIVRDTGLDFTPAGQGIILFLVQLGGFGYMIMLGLIYILLRKKMSNSEKMMLKEIIYYNDLSNLHIFIRRVFLYVLIIESIGAVFLSIDFGYRFGFIEGIYHGIFHSISAFNNAGFSTFSKNLLDFREDLIVNVVVSLLVIFGGLGYICLIEIDLYLRDKIKATATTNATILKRPFKFSFHFKIVIYTSVFLIFIGAILFLFLEYNNPNTIGHFGIFDKVMTSIFTSINLRSSGLGTINIGDIKEQTAFFSTTFMFIGGAPGGTTAGIRVTTFAILFAFFKGLLNGEQARLFNRAIRYEDIQKALVIFLLAMIYFIVIAFLLVFVQLNINFMDLAFEIVSALTNVGYSRGDGGVLSLVANFNDAGKIILAFSALLGKVGIILSLLALFGRFSTKRVNYIEERVLL